ncbi:glycerophosphodiester phosphodiesterase family protein [Kribbella sp. VKM Ac-2566]|uniref:glycerophosphodiester phosphodiesterase n=1 Tax=Kribbella sp. VKM Ac-2566 TaxID=2512218 RepID=UPI0010632A90|nr:glycerophosphodiester phosphodiesterase family protein [Kribbella sp. VKM Ac-2566]TDW81294.1 glycerophosphoryl diester phosphodiesterase [Kribbella sp. VKM Ac-2566]
MIITGHRGALGTEPENTLRSFRRAVADGCDEIELDLRVSADGELVIMHDATVDRTTSGSGAVEELTLAELRALDAGLGEQVPTWTETVAAIDVRFQAEVKAEAAVPLLAQSLKSDRALAERTLVTSFHPEILLAVREAFPDVTTGHIFGRTPDTAEIITRTRAAGATWSLCGIAGLTPDAVADLHAAGLSVTAWPVPDPETLTKATALAADGITTDNPHLLQHL